MVLKTALTFRSMTFAKAESGCLSKASPHVAPALAKRISTVSVCFLTCSSKFLTPSMVEESEGTETAFAPGDRFGRAFRAVTASSQALALREVMKTLDAPDWRKLWE